MDGQAETIVAILLSCQCFSEGEGVKRVARGHLARHLLAAALLGCYVLLPGCFHAHEAIRDLRTVPQDATFYLDPAHADQEAVTAQRQAAWHARFEQIFYAPWHRDQPFYPRDDLWGRLAKYREDPGYGENQQPHARIWIDQLAATAQPGSYPNAGYPAITVAHSDLRELPTHHPHFHSFDQAGAGYPFDNLQYSSIAANTPVFVSHVSRDGSWVLTESHYGLGWLPARDVALVDQVFITTWEQASRIVFIADGVPVVANDGLFLFEGSLGMPLPLVEADTQSYRVMAATADADRRAVVRLARIGRQYAVLQPLRPTAAHVAQLVNVLLQQPYGWGGAYGNRDCSATLKDLFAPFGFMLPRNSSYQATRAGSFIPLGQLSSAEKQKTIGQQGIPYFTLLWLKGHIMLYLGSYRGQSVVFHNFWGIKTRDWLGREGRKVVGQAAITTLHPGAELAAGDGAHGGFLKRLEGMTLLVPRPPARPR
jgi:hypothetical protein